jgi:hypothetical protein
LLSELSETHIHERTALLPPWPIADAVQVCYRRPVHRRFEREARDTMFV